MKPIEKHKRVGKYSVYLWEHYSSYYSPRGKGKVMKGEFAYSELAVFLVGEEKSLQRSEQYEKSFRKGQARQQYSKLSSEKAIEEWIRDRGY